MSSRQHKTIENYVQVSFNLRNIGDNKYYRSLVTLYLVSPKGTRCDSLWNDIKSAKLYCNLLSNKSQFESGEMVTLEKEGIQNITAMLKP